jgi:hypothetical protein
MTAESMMSRRFPRLSSENAVLVKVRSHEPVEGFAKTRVLGLGGCMFMNDEPIGQGAHLDMLISVRGRVAKTVGRVVYEIPRADQEIEVGVEFVGLSAHDRGVIESVFPDGGPSR